LESGDGVGIGNFGKVGVGYFISDSATLVTTACHHSVSLMVANVLYEKKCFFQILQTLVCKGRLFDQRVVIILNF